MKTKNFAKISLLVLSLMLLAGAVFAMTAGAVDATKPEIFSQNVEYNDKFSLMYAVKADTVSGGSVTLNIYDEEPTETTDPIASYTVKNVTSAADSGAAYDAYIITTDGVAAMALDQKFYVQAVDGDGNESAVKSYSVVEYLYTRLADVDDKANTETQNNLYKSVINFGTCAQQQFLTEAELKATTLISNYCYVTTDGCTVDGKTAAVVPQDKAFTIVGDDGALSACTVTTYNTYDTTGTATETEVTGSSVTITDSYRAHIVAGAAKTYKAGTETFDSYNVGDMPFQIAGNNTLTMADSNAKLAITTTSCRKDGTFTVASDKVYGKVSDVLKFEFLASVDLQFYPTQGSVAQADANALELSFDFKLDKSIGTGVYRIYFNNGNNGIGIKIGVEDGKLYIKDTRTDKPVIVNTDANPYEWNNLRFVIVDMYSTAYETTVPRLHVYVNNDTETPTKTIDFNNSNTKFSLVDTLQYFHSRFVDHETDAHPIAYFDNVWCGYTISD